MISYGSGISVSSLPCPSLVQARAFAIFLGTEFAGRYPIAFLLLSGNRPGPGELKACLLSHERAEAPYPCAIDGG